ncbi:hypothetical protein P7K49_032619 [Saguinus oedipus]|uniref:EGF-like calcium-binding domain-containing protein n=1 Tax=Saguinus oedipus TaxID=9490 RepID=A0ABQ9TYS5_SAGOE|nr:hypothetical protein P7K49_032619 [Saguinus oedipus]
MPLCREVNAEQGLVSSPSPCLTPVALVTSTCPGATIINVCPYAAPERDPVGSWYNVTVLVKMDFAELQQVDPRLLNHTRLLHSLVGAIYFFVCNKMQTTEVCRWLHCEVCALTGPPIVGRARIPELAVVWSPSKDRRGFKCVSEKDSSSPQTSFRVLSGDLGVAGKVYFGDCWLGCAVTSSPGIPTVTSALQPLISTVHHLHSAPGDASTTVSRLLLGLPRPLPVADVSGLLGDIAKRVCEVISVQVQDVNECFYDELNACSGRELCANLEGSYQCVCHQEAPATSPRRLNPECEGHDQCLHWNHGDKLEPSLASQGQPGEQKSLLGAAHRRTCPALSLLEWAGVYEPGLAGRIGSAIRRLGTGSNGVIRNIGRCYKDDTLRAGV